MKNNKKGFTLVELLAVIVILGVLLLVAVPAISNVIANSKRGVAKDEAIQVLNALYNCSLSSGSICDKNTTATYLDNIGSIDELTTSGTYDNITITKLTYKSKDGYSVVYSDATGKSLSALKNAINAVTFNSGTSVTVS